MKTITAILLLTASLCHAQRIVPLVFTFTGTAEVQSDYTTNNNLLSARAPVAHKITSGTTLQTLALDEFQEGNYASKKFPSGAKLVLLNYSDDFASSHFVVTDSAMNQICDVSDILTWSAQMNQRVESGQTTTGVPDLFKNVKQNYIANLTFDDTGAGGGQNITYQFLVSSLGNDVVSKDGFTYKETITATISNGSGNGTYDGQYLYVTCTAKASGSAVIAF